MEVSDGVWPGREIYHMARRTEPRRSTPKRRPASLDCASRTGSEQFAAAEPHSSKDGDDPRANARWVYVVVEF
jgi:hypothetical protein